MSGRVDESGDDFVAHHRPLGERVAALEARIDHVLGERLAEIDQRLDALEGRFDAFNKGLAEVSDGLEKVRDRLRRIELRLAGAMTVSYVAVEVVLRLVEGLK